MTIARTSLAALSPTARRTARTVAITLVTVLCLPALCWAQAATPKLRLIAHAEARGGTIEQCVFDQAGAHMLTAGEEGDLVYHDLKEFDKLQHVDLPQTHLVAMALHPTEPWALVSTTTGDFAHGQLHRLDLATGSWQEISRRYVQGIGFDRDGARVALTVLRGNDAYCDGVRIELCESVALDAPRLLGELKGRRWASPTPRYAPSAASRSSRVRSVSAPPGR